MLTQKCAERYTAVQRSQHLTQADPRIFGQSYVANCSSVDGQGAFLGEQADHSHIAYFQSLEKSREQGLPCDLPTVITHELSADPGLKELDKQVEQLTSQPEHRAALDEVKRQRASYGKSLKTTALRQHQEQWVQER